MIHCSGPASWRRLALALVVLLFFGGSGMAQQKPLRNTGYVPLIDRGLRMSLWAREPLLKNPVALSFDDQGRLYVVETARRGSVDIDIRAHKQWVKEDLGSDSIPRQRELFRMWMAPEKSLENRSWLQDRNRDESHDWRDLTMVKERVHLIEDLDGDGTADKSQVFAEGFNEFNNGVAAGVLPYGDQVFFTVYPDVWRLRDTDGDGISDDNEIMFRGFGVHAAYDGHDIHGLTVGPDGWIYFSVGDNGTSVKTKEGKRLHHPNTGGVLRMKPDGSNLEFYAIGLRNVQEIAFDDYGNLFSVDNDGDIRGERERFVYITEGSDSGWRLNWQFRTQGWSPHTGMPTYSPWIEEKMWLPHHEGQAAYITPPMSNYSVGPSGFKYNPGAALNEQYRGFFFLAQFPVKKITAFRVQPKGAYFEMVDEHVFHQGLMASAINFGPDGAAYIADWDGMWMPNDKGAIFKVDDPSASRSLLREEVQRLIATPFTGQSKSNLVKWLGHVDQRIRLKSQFEMVRRGDMTSLIDLIDDTAQPLLARVHALWGLGQFEEQVAARFLKRLPLADPNPEIRAQAVKLVGDLRAMPLSNHLISLLNDANPRVQFMAGIALGKLGDRSGFQGVTRMLKKNRGIDPYIRHAGIMAWSGMKDVSALWACASNPSMHVRLAAVVALRRLKAPEVRVFLKDAERLVVNEAARAIHDDFSIIEALPELARVLDAIPTKMQNDEALIRRVISANMRLGQLEHAQRLMAYAENGKAPDVMRLEALESLATWDADPFLDRVVGRVRVQSGRIKDLGSTILDAGFQKVLDSSTADFRMELVRLAEVYDIEVNDATLADWVMDTKVDTATRVRALSALTQSEYSGLADLIPGALQVNQSSLRSQAMRAFAVHDQNGFGRFFSNQGPSLTIPEQQLGLQLLGTIRTDPSASVLKAYLMKVNEGSINPRLRLDVVQAASNHGGSALSKGMGTYRRGLGSPLELHYHAAALVGGDAERGRKVFYSHLAGQCVRCHEAGGARHQVGPELRGIGGMQTRAYLLESLVQPSAQLAEGYALTTLTLSNGEKHSGRLLTDDEEGLVLIDLSGQRFEFARPDIAQQLVVQVSSMPPMGALLTPFELRDLVEFLATWK
ncbi:MAG: HEAT repeat domain-containing protein [Verrucomicrobiota bacterium]|nr:HEAT repeat domain-containing protein [Verrucomicrobiota bacterium]